MSFYLKIRIVKEKDENNALKQVVLCNTMSYQNSITLINFIEYTVLYIKQKVDIQITSILIDIDDNKLLLL